MLVIEEFVGVTRILSVYLRLISNCVGSAGDAQHRNK